MAGALVRLAVADPDGSGTSVEVRATSPSPDPDESGAGGFSSRSRPPGHQADPTSAPTAVGARLAKNGCCPSPTPPGLARGVRLPLRIAAVRGTWPWLLSGWSPMLISRTSGSSEGAGTAGGGGGWVVAVPRGMMPTRNAGVLQNCLSVQSRTGGRGTFFRRSQFHPRTSRRRTPQRAGSGFSLIGKHAAARRVGHEGGATRGRPHGGDGTVDQARDMRS